MHLRVTKLKKYRITYAPTLDIAQEVVDPYDDWNADNVHGRFFYTPIHNHDRSISRTMEVEALPKKAAKAIFTVRLYMKVISKGIEGGTDPFVIDGVRNIIKIEEVKNDE